MLLKSLEPLKYGPFTSGAILEVEPDVTVLTGPNDTGKSSLLHLIARICSTEDATKAAQESEFNLDCHHEEASAWNYDTEFGALATFRVDNESLKACSGTQNVEGAEEIVIACNIAPSSNNRVIRKLRAPTKTIGLNLPVRMMPRTVLLPPVGQIRNEIELNKPSLVETNLLRLAFGPQFSFGQLASMSVQTYQRQIRSAEEKLNDWLGKVVPSSLSLGFALMPDAQNREKLALSLRDGHGGLTPFGSRGAGIQRVMTLLAALMGNDFDTWHTIVLVDEPETSLHADSQHLVRRLLEDLAVQPNVQVIYATHSPSMVNVLRPHSLRLLHRTRQNEKATTVIDNRPFKDNYLPIRSSLGLTPADSLLYAPLTIVVEGDTEVIGLPLLLAKLSREKAIGFEKAEQLLSQTHILGGMGDSFAFMCQLAKSQGAHPVVFLDGDKKRHLKKFGLEKAHADVPVITLDDGKEFEELIPEEVYFQAVAKVLDESSDRVSSSTFRQWEQSTDLPKGMVFTKRVNRWLGELSLPELNKAAVIRLAIELAKVQHVETRPLLELIEHLTRLLS